MEQNFDYDVFLSYRHKSLDSVITQKTFHFLESYRLPASLRRKGYRDIHRAFRDTEELPVSRILTDTIDNALRSTNCLLLICSTDTPSSEWVDREVATFIELGRAEKIYPLLISGSPEVSFPPSLKRVPDIMDRVMDIRTPGNPVRKMIAKEDPELLKIIAGITGCPFRELQREHGMRKARRFLLKACTAVAVFGVAVAVSLGLMNMAQNYRDQARAAERSSMQVLEELTYGLPNKLTNVPGAYSKISGILKENAQQINEILALSTDKTGAQYDIAANYEKLATAMSVLGSYDEAAVYQQEAIALYTQLSEEEGDLATLASAKNNYGKVLNQAGSYEAAAQAFREAIDLQRQVGSEPVRLATMLSNAGSNAISQGREEEAIALFQECGQVLAAAEESDYDAISIRADSDYNYGILLYRRGEYARAEQVLSESVARYDQMYARVDSRQNQNSWAKAVSALAMCQADQGNYDSAIENYSLAIGIAENLAADGENTDAMNTLAGLYNNCGICLSVQSRFQDADYYFSASAQVYGGISQKTGTAADRAVYAVALLNTGENAFKAGRYDHSREQFAQGLEVFEGAVSELGDYYASQYYAWACYNAVIHERDFEKAVDYGVEAVNLQPGNVLANINLGYACLYAGYYEDCDLLLTWACGLADGVSESVRLDLKVQQQAGLHSDHTAALLEKLP